MGWDGIMNASVRNGRKTGGPNIVLDCNVKENQNI